MSFHMRNRESAETAPAHRLGTAEDGRAIYQATEGWDLVGDNFDPDTDCERDCDGNYLVSN